MNQGYTYKEGKAIVKTDKGIKEPIEYYDNLDEVLLQENLIETMENNILSLEKESENYKKNNRKHYFPFFLLGVPIVLITLSIGVALYATSGNSDVNVFEVVGDFVLNATVCSVACVPITALMELRTYEYYKNLLSEEKGINSGLEFLKKQVIIEKEKLNTLKKERNENKCNEQQTRVVEVNDLELLEKLKKSLNLYFDLGYNEDAYYEYYQNGTLDANLSQDYNGAEIEIAKKYLEEKGPTLTKKRKK